MSYLVLARKYRPQDFTSVTGQEHVTRTLKNSIARNKVGHAYLFAGPRGVGKTSVARIFSKALNCEKGPTPEPCGRCANCEAITKGTSLAVREIDGASHNSVDNVRDLIDSFRSLPAPGSKYKIYIIDEVHMLSTSAFNALLKSLEEPPPHTVFILATTELHKIPETVISRCQRHDFRALGTEEIESRLAAVVKSEKIEIENEVIRMVARLADGSMRDAQSLLDRVQSFSDGKITAAEAGKVLGAADRSVLSAIAGAIAARSPGLALEELDKVLERGIDISLFLKELVFYWRELLILKFAGEKALSKLGVSDDELTELKRQAESVTKEDMQDLVDLVRTGADSALRSTFPRYALEALLVRLCQREKVEDFARLVGDLRGATIVGQSRPAAIQSAESAPAVRAAQPSAQARPQPAKAAPVKASFELLDLVKFASDNGARMLAEQLKRLSVIEFEPGIFSARGPDFSVRYLEDKGAKAKLEEVLEKLSGKKAWKIKFEAVPDGEPVAGSIVYEQREKTERTKREREEAISSHPKIKSLQRVFPGSKIEEPR